MKACTEFEVQGEREYQGSWFDLRYGGYQFGWWWHHLALSRVFRTEGAGAARKRTGLEYNPCTRKRTGAMETRTTVALERNDEQKLALNLILETPTVPRHDLTAFSTNTLRLQVWQPFPCRPVV